MAKVLLFTGEKSVGKSTALRKVLTTVGIDYFEGFVADECRKDGERCGFDVVLLDGRRGSLASIDSTSENRVGGLNEMGVPRYGVDLDFLENVAIPLLRESAESAVRKVLVVDEIGPMQLYSASFQKVITELVTADDIILLGTIVLRSLPWTDELKSRDNVESFMLTFQNRDTMTKMMAIYMRQILRAQGVTSA